jgi:phosphate transport system substrate-binding protein
MRKLFFAAFAISLGFPLCSGAGEIRIAGTGSALGTMKLIANAYNQSHPQAKAHVLESVGSSGGIRAVAKGSIEIGLSSRELTEEEARQELRSIEYARSPTVFAVRTKNKVTAITVKEVLAIYSGKLTHWPDGTLIRPVLRQPGEDNTKQILTLSPEMASSLSLAEKRQGLPFAVTDQDTADKIESIPGSIGVTTLGIILSENRTLRPLILDGVRPTPENANTGRYPMVKRLYLVLPKNPSPETTLFVNFLNSKNGRDILKRTGHTIP